MRKYTKKTENQSRTLDSNPKTSRQTPIDVILQRYKERNIQQYVEDEEELLQGKFTTSTTQREEIPSESGGLLQLKTILARDGGCIQMALTPHIDFSTTLNAAITAYNTTPSLNRLLDLLDDNDAEKRSLWFFQFGKHDLHDQLTKEIKSDLQNPAIMSQAVQTNAALPNYNIPRIDFDQGGQAPQNTQTHPAFETTIYSDMASLAVKSKTFRHLLRFAIAKRTAPNPHHIVVAPENLVGGAGMMTDTLSPQANLNAGVAGIGDNAHVNIDTLANDYRGVPRSIALAHELIHSLHVLYGVRALSNSIYAPGQSFTQYLAANPGVYPKATPDDVAVMGNIGALNNVQANINAIYTGAGVAPLPVHVPPGLAPLNVNLADITENAIRAELGLPLRPTY